MSHVDIQFQGLCVNFQPRIEQIHRVVLPRVTEGMVVKNKTIVGHGSTLQFGSAFVELDGYTARIANALPAGFVYGLEYWRGIPNLTQLMMAQNVDLGPADPRYLVGTDSSLLNLRFELTSGSFTSCYIFDGAACTFVRVETDGPPVLELTAFPGATSQGPFTLTDGDLVTVTNIEPAGITATEAKFDFLASYMTAELFDLLPDDLPIPQLALGIACPSGGGDGLRYMVGAECSNSNFP